VKGKVPRVPGILPRFALWIVLRSVLRFTP
jgi:hypothetical protein